ncbi:GTPase [Kitasatospora phosalacinea]|uniref:GTPase n=1 Tax=Kitasatospora phosalacinea TaxID=2065 RepID=UPI0035DF0778
MGAEDEDGLERAVAEAVARSGPVADGLRGDAEQLVRVLRERTGGLTPTAGADDHGLLAHGAVLVREITDELSGLTGRRLGALDTFNLVLFGRTGAGKSSLREALTRGDGESISPLGESDWTTGVAAMRWRGCQVVDTPGIAGWGRTTTRTELEESAREALVLADVVILCFDSQSQQAAEFAKVAEWIAAYGKPVVAVLNNRNPLWRFPTRVPGAQARRTLSRAVAEHAQNITDELARIGLHHVPVVALQTKRAVFARAVLPYLGPDERTLHLHRAEAGSPEALLDWSNLPVLERLLGRALGRDAVGLRLGALVRQIGGAYARAQERFREEVEEPARYFAEQTELTVERMLTVLGAPATVLAPGGPDAPGGPTAAEERLVAALAELEGLRGGRFRAPPLGEAARYGEHLVLAALAPEREAARRRAEQVIDRAMETGEVVGPEAFAARVFDPEATENALREAVEEVAAHLERRIGLVVADAAADLRAAAAGSARIQGDAGRLLRRVGVAAGAGGALAGAGSGALATLVIANVWNPVGWSVGGILIAGAVAGLVGRFVSRWSRARAHRRKEEAIANARADARRSVSDTFEQARAAAIGKVDELVRRGMAQPLDEAVRTAVGLRRISAVAADCRTDVGRVAERLPATEDPTGVLRGAARELESAAARSGRSAAARLWLGESWLDDDGTEPRRRTGNEVPFEQPEFAAWVERAAAGPFSVPAPVTGRDWLAATRRRLADDPAAADVLDRLDALAADARPKVLVCGDYSTGKSSLIRRLLVDAGLPVPEDLSVAAGPETATAKHYDLGDLVLVDTPGFQSGRDDHADRARLSVPDAAAVLYLFSPNLVTGERADLDLVLGGDPERHWPGKFDRTVLVLNRTDAIGPDPFDAPEEFERLCRRKRLELATAINAAADPGRPAVVPEQVVCVSADPYGLRGARAEDFAPHRHWDGTAALREALAVLRRRILVNGVDVAVLHGGLAGFGALHRDALDEERTARDRADQFGRLHGDVADRLADGRALSTARAARLAELVGEFVDRELARTLRSTDPAEREVLAERLAAWASNKDLHGIVEQWWDESQRKTAEWRRDTAHTFRHRVGSAEFNRVFPDAGAVAALHVFAGRAAPDLRKKAAKGLGWLGTVVGKADAKVISTVGVWLNRALDPVAAARGAVALARLGAGLSAVAAAVDVYGLVRGIQEDRELDRGRRAGIAALHEDAARWSEQAAWGTERVPGPLRVLAADLDELDAAVRGIAARRDEHEQEAGLVRNRIDAYRGVIDHAYTCLGRGPGTPTPGGIR